MPSLNFKRQFAEAVANGTKRQTIRAKGKRAWKVGDKLYFFTVNPDGKLTQKRLGRATLLAVKQIRVNAEKREIHLEKQWDWGGRYLAHLFDDEALEFAQEDGFDTLDAFFAFFLETYGRCVSGYLLKW